MALTGLAAPAALARRDAIEHTRRSLRKMLERLPDSPESEAAFAIYRMWDQRLREESGVLQDVPLSHAASAAVLELVDDADALDEPQFILDWLDLLPRNALALAAEAIAQPALQEVALGAGAPAVTANIRRQDDWRSTFARPQASQLANCPARAA